VNFEGTSGGMEVAAALQIFSNSEERNSLRYVKYIGDGDSRAFRAIIKMKPYKSLNGSALGRYRKEWVRG
jgi:hypothetical protein